MHAKKGVYFNYLRLHSRLLYVVNYVANPLSGIIHAKYHIL